MNYEIINFDVHGDNDGSLIAIEGKKNIPFDIKRVYYIYGNKKELVRGKHAHMRLEQVVICTSGSCDFTVDDGVKKETFHLDSPAMGLYMKNMVWREFTNFSDDCVIIVFASDYYDGSEYIRDYNQFLEKVNHG